MKVTKHIEKTNELASLVSEYLTAKHAAKAQEIRAEKAKDNILQLIEANPEEHCNYVVCNKTETTNFCITYTEGITGYTSDEVAIEITALKARIKELETLFGVRGFKFYSMRERKV